MDACENREVWEIHRKIVQKRNNLRVTSTAVIGEAPPRSEQGSGRLSSIIKDMDGRSWNGTELNERAINENH